MKVLTLHQPWAQLVAVGAKTIETRSWDTKYRGPLAIHAAKTTPATEQWEEGPFDDIGDPDGRCFQFCRGEEPGDDWSLYDVTSHGIPSTTAGAMWRMPLGAIVVTCELVGVVPMVGFCGTDMHAPGHLCFSGDGLLLHRPTEDPFPDGETERDVSDQRPFGDFTPGRFAWILEEIDALDEPDPFTGGQGLSREWTP